MEIAAASTLAAVRLRTAIRPAAVRPGPIRREPSLVIDHDLPDPAVKEPRVLKASPPPHLVESFVRRREQEKQHQQELVNARASDLSSEADVASSCGRRSPPPLARPLTWLEGGGGPAKRRAAAQGQRARARAAATSPRPPAASRSECVVFRALAPPPFPLTLGACVFLPFPLLTFTSLYMRVTNAKAGILNSS